MVVTGVGFGVGGEVSCLGGEDFMGLLNWEWSSMGIAVSGDSPVGSVDDRSGVVRSNGVDDW